MADIYQKIWTSDQDSSGVVPILSSMVGDAATGYVKVNAGIGSDTNPDLRVLPEVVIPDSKAQTYALCRKLFNNYALPEADLEVDNAVERTEKHDFVDAILNSPPMRVARAYIEERTESPISDERWHTTLIDHWFRRFEQGGDPHLSGFEHVVVGEQEGPKVQGYHFWYKYYLDDGFARQVDDGLAVVPGLGDDRIVYLGNRGSRSQRQFPESVTISYKWNAPDYDRQEVRPLTKPTGGFFVGCSVEGLMALGTVAAHVGAKAPRVAVIEGARYEMKLYRSPNDRHIRTFYPMFLGEADPVTLNDTVIGGGEGPRDGTAGDVRILAALVNPTGNDVGREMVTVVNAGPVDIDLTGWSVRDKNGKSSPLGALTAKPGVPVTVTLDGKGAQLSNSGGSIDLLRGDGARVHQVTYSKAQAKAENRTIIFS
ncbi:lamin tail domain-containing protein [Tropicibacter sp. S64]|uniref:lamin tail domain-containing protein n=1 Tax=Tropicibacter sp. S64 TaxID=3415122 RepID=UPI003C7A7893